MRPPGPGSTTASCANQRTSDCGSEIAFHTTSRGASMVSSCSWARVGLSLLMSFLHLGFRPGRVPADDEAVGPSLRALLVVLGGQARDRAGQLMGERGAIGRAGEAHVDLEGHRGQAFVRLGGAAL